MIPLGRNASDSQIYLSSCVLRNEILVESDYFLNVCKCFVDVNRKSLEIVTFTPSATGSG